MSSNMQKALQLIDNIKPRGADFAAAHEIGVRINHALSLPGKVAPLSAARAIQITAYNILQEEGVI